MNYYSNSGFVFKNVQTVHDNIHIYYILKTARNLFNVVLIIQQLVATAQVVIQL